MYSSGFHPTLTFLLRPGEIFSVSLWSLPQVVDQLALRLVSHTLLTFQLTLGTLLVSLIRVKLQIIMFPEIKRHCHTHAAFPAQPPSKPSFTQSWMWFEMRCSPLHCLDSISYP
ncbi:hypothetical protein CVT25_002351 [Psilocybe cyanescens]|uniref:Uncharacterized protein n=1 Tax=Psilocybe cyanescens TaxID=93625 RepID=A0A409WKM1_PSICY|nr:hypothetical protein CVT25_002351 [Psilocybe cyanescens]